MDYLPLAIYLHWPFCRKICPYCHFNRFLDGPLDIDKWRKAFFTELSFWHKKTPNHRVVSIFWGGGTPSLMPITLCGDILEYIGTLWSVSASVEITLEMNPNEYHRISEFYGAGINRFSLGVQSFQEESLAILGRDHDPAMLMKSLKTCEDLGVSYSFDLIYGHEGHKDPSLWAKDLHQSVPWVKNHISLYQLSYEEQTPFYTKRHLHLGEDELLHLESLTANVLGPLGLQPYEVSNYAKPGWESRHNLAYWRYEDFIGVGPGAHGRLKLLSKEDQGFSGKNWEQWAFVDEKRPDIWMKHLEEKGHGLKEGSLLSYKTKVYEHLLMSLRLTEGVDLQEVFHKGPKYHNTQEYISRDYDSEDLGFNGESLPRNIPKNPGSHTAIHVNLDIPEDFLKRLHHCVENGLMKKEHSRIYLTEKGRNVLNEIIHFLGKNYS